MAGKGGKRAGAGRKPGSRNKRTQQQADAAAAGGITPLDYLLALMRNEAMDPLVRLDAAKSAAPYVHAKLANIQHSGNAKQPIQVVVNGSAIDG